MSKADEMFEELGYERRIYKDTDELFELRYENNGKEIWFDKLREEFGSLSGIGVKELQAISEKVKELGWLFELPGEDRKTIETVLQALEDFEEGNIVSIKLLENFYLVSKDKEKQMIFANKELFDDYIPKEVIREKINERQFELQQEYKDFKDDIILKTLQDIYYEGEKKYEND